MATTQGLELRTDLCTACRACELACHYHHQATFGTTASSIHVDFDGATGVIEVQIDSSCDGCGQEPRPLCLSACSREAIRLSET
jgi:Fe-S-cluster-containing dehydrogenase component